MAQTTQTEKRKLAVFIPYSKGVSAKEAIQRAGEAGMAIASNARMDKALVRSNEWESIKDAFPCWTGTMTAYVEQDTAFNKSKIYSQELKAIVYTDPETKEKWIFPVGDYGKERNAILVSEHPDYAIETSKDEILVKPRVVDLVPNFPEKGGWYLTDGKYGIPVGKTVDSDDTKTRYLHKLDDGRVGPVARGYVNGWGIGLCCWPSLGFGVASFGKAAAGGAAPEAKPAQITVAMESGKLVIDGTKEQLDMVKKLLKTAEQLFKAKSQ